MSEEDHTPKPESFDPYIDLLRAIFGDIHTHATTGPPMTPYERLEWLKENMPRTYILVTSNHDWGKFFGE